MDELQAQDGIRAEEALELVFEDTASPPAAAGPSPWTDLVPPRSKPPGPGLPESLLWMIGLLVVQLAGGVLGVVFVLVMHVAQNGPEGLSASAFQQVVTSQMLTYVAIGQAFFLASAVLSAALRLGRGFSRKLPLSPVSLLHGALLAALVLPMSIVCGEVYRLADIPWQLLVEQIPILKQIDAGNVMQQMKALVNGPWPVVFFSIAVVPAVAEEILFRGVIGRGLAARWGIPAGVLITSVLFASAHVHPVHVIGVVPLGIVMHLSYLATRSFWAPVFLHFVNNSMATVMVYAQEQLSPGLGADESAAAPELVAVALAASLATLILLWNTRVRYVLPGGSEWDPGYPTTDIPPAEAHAVPERRRASPVCYAVAVLSVIGFVAMFVAVAAREVP